MHFLDGKDYTRIERSTRDRRAMVEGAEEAASGRGRSFGWPSLYRNNLSLLSNYYYG